MAWPAALRILEQYEPMRPISQPHRLPRFCLLMLIPHRYAASVGTNFGQRGMGCALPADRYFYPIANQGWIFLRNTHPCDNLFYFQACFTLTQHFAGQAYSENPADFKPLTTEEMARIKAEKRQKDQVPQISLEDIYLDLFLIEIYTLQAKKLKISENRKHLANVRVVQKNLVFVVGLSPRWTLCSPFFDRHKIAF